MQIDDLQPLVLDQPFEADSSCQAHLDFYQLNFAAKMDNVSHHIGYIDSHPYKIVCYYFQSKSLLKPALLFMDIWIT